jgi:dCMP deaminase
MENRISRKKYYREAALLISRRSSCLKKKVGAILVKDKRIIAQGYNGLLPGDDHLLELDNEGVSHTVHAEANVIAFCAKHGISTNGATMYVTLSPCEKCAELIIQAGIIKVEYKEIYRDQTGLYILKKHNIIE